MKFKRCLPLLPLLMFSVFLFSSCEELLEEEPPAPTNDLMEGVWRVSAVYDQNGVDITDTVTDFFPTFFHLDDANSVNSTAGPMFMYIVYGKSKFINITSKLDQVFKYVDIQLTEGEWFIDKNKVVDKFTLEIKMKFPTMETVNEIFQLLNVKLPEIVADATDIVVYHKFRNVTVLVNEENPDRMIWELNDDVQPTYNTKDQFGDNVAYTGIGIDAFSRCQIVLEKQVKTITQLVTESAQAKVE